MKNICIFKVEVYFIEMYPRILFALIFIFRVFILFPQELIFEGFRHNPVDISARESAVFDANGDACALIKARTGFDSISVKCDLEIRKIEKHEGEYWIWVSPGTSYIEVTVKDIEAKRFDLPILTKEFNVYLVFILAVGEKVLEYLDLYDVKIDSKPSSSDIFINKEFFGKTPLRTSIIESIVELEISHHGFISQIDTVDFSNTNELLYYRLSKDPNINSIYITMLYGINNNFSGGILSVEFGLLGKTGFYMQTSIPYNYKKFEVECSIDCREMVEIRGFKDDSYYYELKGEEILSLNHFRISFGVTQNLAKSLFYTGGIGLSYHDIYFKLKKVSYSENEVVGDAYGIYNVNFPEKFHFRSKLLFESGIILRLRNSITIELKSSIYRPYYGNSFYSIDSFFGIGYKF